MVHFIQKAKAAVSHKITAVKDTAASLAFRGRHILSGNAGEGYIDTAIKILLAVVLGALLLAGGAPGKRLSLPNARIMIHQPLGGTQGQATEVEIHAREILKLRDRLNDILVKHTGQTK